MVLQKKTNVKVSLFTQSAVVIVSTITFYTWLLHYTKQKSYMTVPLNK